MTGSPANPQQASTAIPKMVLAFGLELEFLAFAAKEDEHCDPNPDDPRWYLRHDGGLAEGTPIMEAEKTQAAMVRAKIASVLRAGGIPAVTEDEVKKAIAMEGMASASLVELALYLPVEDAFFGLCAPWRRSGRALSYCPPLMDYSHAVHNRDDPRPRQVRAAIAKIRAAPAFHVLRDDVLSKKSSALPQRCCIAVGSVGFRRNTLEVRMLQGTLDPGLIVQWVRLLLAWVASAAALDNAACDHLIDSHIALFVDPWPEPYAHATERLLRDLGIGDDDTIAFWRAQISQHATNPAPGYEVPFLPPLPVQLARHPQ